METILSIAVGLVLAAACGFRVVLPLAGLGIAASLGRVPLADGFAWVASTPPPPRPSPPGCLPPGRW